MRGFPPPLVNALKTKTFHQLTLELIRAGRLLYQKGWVPATSGNFSARVDDRQIAITVSGKHKGQLTPADIMAVDLQGRSLDGQTPSAETWLHIGLYQRFPEVNAILHPHSINATLISHLFSDELTLEGYELLKALEGIDTHETRIVVPIFANTQNIPELAAQADAYLSKHPDCRAYIIAGHGFYTWGSSIAVALRQVEALEFMFECAIRLQGTKR